MPDERLIAIAARLRELTADRKLRWQPAGQGDEDPPRAFATRLATGSAVISAAHPDGRFPYELRLLDPARVEIGRVGTGQDAEQWLGDREADPWEQELEGLYAAARGSAVNAGAALDAILEELRRR